MFDYLKLGAGALLGALVVFGIQEFRMASVVSDAVSTEADKQVKICNGRVAQTANDINAASDELLDKALEAARAIGRTPVDQAELQDVCNSETSCRDRKVKP